jgi:DNA-binding response OmpR family regulator
LEDAGCETRTAADGLQALEEVQAFRPDIALLDLGMPKLNGCELAKRIRAQNWGEHVILIAVTGWGDVENRVRVLAAGFDRHLTKPVEPNDLLRLLSTIRNDSLPAGDGFAGTV